MVNCPLTYFMSHRPQMPSGMSKYVSRIIICYTHEHIIWLNQSEIPEGSNPLCFILYANKTKLSSFGMTKGYPVITHCVNLPTMIQNGNGFGGGCVVGWLPVVWVLFLYFFINMNFCWDFWGLKRRKEEGLRQFQMCSLAQLVPPCAPVNNWILKNRMLVWMWWSHSALALSHCTYLVCGL